MPTNEDRADRGQSIICHYRDTLTDDRGASDQTILADILADLRHAVTDDEWEKAALLAETHYEEEAEADW